MIEPKNKGGGSHEGPPHLTVPAKTKPVKPKLAAAKTTGTPTPPSKPSASKPEESVQIKSQVTANSTLAAEIKKDAEEITRLKEANDKLEKAKKGRKKRSKVKQSPVKGVGIVEAEQETETRCDCVEDECGCERFVSIHCPCADFNEARVSLQCTTCYTWFHGDCANLKGLTEAEISLLVGWTCIPCWVIASPLAQMLLQKTKVLKDVAEAGTEVAELPDVTEGGTDVTLKDLSKEILELKGLVRLSQMSSVPAVAGPSPPGLSGQNCQTVGLMMKEQLHLQVPIITACVKDVMDAGVKKIIDSNADQKKTWADMAKGYEDKVAKVATLNRDMLEDVVSSSNQKQAERTESNINHEQYERLRRKMNVIIRKVPESDSEVISERIRHDREWLIENTDIKEVEIVRCMRPGQKRPGKPRPLICQLKDEDLVQRYTDYGKGSKIGDGLPKDSLFINVDLSPADQEADFRARKVRKDSRSRQDSEI